MLFQVSLTTTKMISERVVQEKGREENKTLEFTWFFLLFSKAKSSRLGEVTPLPAPGRAMQIFAIFYLLDWGQPAVIVSPSYLVKYLYHTFPWDSQHQICSTDAVISPQKTPPEFKKIGPGSNSMTPKGGAPQSSIVSNRAGNALGLCELYQKSLHWLLKSCAPVPPAQLRGKCTYYARTAPHL